ncbi:ATP-binding protein [Nitrospira sp. M1]
MKILARLLTIDLPSRQSAFLWGPRKTGKSTYLKSKFPDSVVFDFLQTDLFVEFSKRPALLRERLLAMDKAMLRKPIILDEVQKVPQILDEVHGLIESKGWKFILCGSSARKLKRGQANLLGGRAWRYEMFPLITPEIDTFDLLRALNHGLIPDHYLQANAHKSLRAYVQDYLKEEVFAEGLTRNIPAFSRFFDAMGYSHGEMTNFSNIARDCGVDSKTVKEYYQILVDTLMGSLLPPFRRRQNRQVITKASKFYLFDVGVAGNIVKRRVREERGEAFGKAFEHFILMELTAHRSYHDLEYPIQFWRTSTGLEVDFILGDGEIAIEVKGTNRVDSRELRPLLTFIDEYHPRQAIIVCNEPAERVIESIRIKPWRVFLEELWEGKVMA